jgi:hypothetical protein
VAFDKFFAALDRAEAILNESRCYAHRCSSALVLACV